MSKKPKSVSVIGYKEYANLPESKSLLRWMEIVTELGEIEVRRDILITEKKELEQRQAPTISAVKGLLKRLAKERKDQPLRLLAPGRKKRDRETESQEESQAKKQRLQAAASSSSSSSSGVRPKIPRKDKAEKK